MTAPLALAAALLISACGGGLSAGGNSRGSVALVSSPPSRLYKVALSGVAERPPGARGGRGVAIIAFHADSTVCWRFAHLHGFSAATAAHIQAGTRGRTGAMIVPLALGPRLHHRGCVRVAPAVTRAVWAHPGRYYVSVLSRSYPRGAVRAQL